MTRRAAGRADGRSSTAATPPTTPGRSRFASALVVLGAVLLGTLPAGPVRAAPAAPGVRPVHISVDRLDPRTVVPGAVVEVHGTLVNDSSTTYSDLAVRVQRGDPLRSRAQLADELDSPSEAATVTTPFIPLDGDLAPGGSAEFTYTTTADVLQLSGGVYPLMVNLNGTPAGGKPERVGQLSTQLVVAQPPPARTSVAWLWPITDRPHRDAAGAFTDDELAGEVAPGGRLDRAVDVVEQLPRTPGPDPAQSTPAVPVTLAVDPALLEELSAMAAGRYTAAGRPGTGTADAAGLLQRLRALAAQHPVVALPYADVDVDALVGAGRPAVVTRSLPGTPAGTAAQPVATDGGAAAGSTPTAGEPTQPAPADGAADQPKPAADTGAGAALVRDVLGVAPRTDLAWPAGGTVTPQALDTLQAGGVRTVVLADSALTHGTDATGGNGRPATAHSSLPAAGGDVDTLVADSRLTDLVGRATPDSGAGRELEQRYLAELAVLTGQLTAADPAARQDVLVVPPRRVDPDPAVVGAMMADTATQPGLAPASVAQLGEAPRTATGSVEAGDTGLPLDGLGRIAQAAQVRADLAPAVVGDPDAALAGYDAAIARAGSAQWRGDPTAFRASATDLGNTLGRLRDQVTLLSPVDGTYSLASRDAPLVLTVRNDLPFAVQVRLNLRTRGNVGLTTDDVGVTTLQPTSRATLQVPTHVRQSGGFGVSAQLTTPAGSPLGEAVQMQVKSTAYGRITLAVTIGAAALLGLLFLRRGIRFVVQRRRGGAGADEQVPGGISSVPPTRSPV